MAFAWSGLFVACLCSLKRSRRVRLVSPMYCFFCFLFFFCRSARLAFSFALFHTSSDVMAKISLYTVVFPYPRLFVMET